ncbi:hypothetical protein MMC21_005295 [Puttea exsequens]|nr:hypothetical protein [Puttea exsequens]
MAVVPDADFMKALPKIELHAHLTGSITPSTLHAIWSRRRAMIPSITLEDPLIAMSPSRTWDTQTFFPHFSSYVYNLCSDKESIVFATNAVLNDFMEDGVVYLELRTTPRVSFEVKTEEYVDTILGCIEKFASRDKMSTYLILSIDRRNTYEQAMAVVDLAIQYKHRRVVGIDLCGDPSKGDVSIFKKAFAKAKKHGLKITLHFAEIPESSTREELETLFCFEPDRLGHVIHVPNDLKQEIVRRTIGVELCMRVLLFLQVLAVLGVYDPANPPDTENLDPAEANPEMNITCLGAHSYLQEEDFYPGEYNGESMQKLCAKQQYGGGIGPNLYNFGAFCADGDVVFEHFAYTGQLVGATQSPA